MKGRWSFIPNLVGCFACAGLEVAGDSSSSSDDGSLTPRASSSPQPGLAAGFGGVPASVGQRLATWLCARPHLQPPCTETGAARPASLRRGGEPPASDSSSPGELSVRGLELAAWSVAGRAAPLQGSQAQGAEQGARSLPPLCLCEVVWGVQLLRRVRSKKRR